MNAAKTFDQNNFYDLRNRTKVLCSLRCGSGMIFRSLKSYRIAPPATGEERVGHTAGRQWHLQRTFRKDLLNKSCILYIYL